MLTSRSSIRSDQSSTIVLLYHFVSDLKLVVLEVFVEEANASSNRMLIMIYLIHIFRDLILVLRKLQGLFSELFLVNDSLFELCLHFLGFGMEVGYFFDEKLVMSLLSIGVFARE